jgi:hypothetical protein
VADREYTRPPAAIYRWTGDPEAAVFMTTVAVCGYSSRDAAVLWAGSRMMLVIPCETVDSSAYPDLVMIHLSARVNSTTGFKTLVGFRPQISAAQMEVVGIKGNITTIDNAKVTMATKRVVIF